jgi:hypothetical protein
VVDDQVALPGRMLVFKAGVRFVDGDAWIIPMNGVVNFVSKHAPQSSVSSLVSMHPFIFAALSNSSRSKPLTRSHDRLFPCRRNY